MLPNPGFLVLSWMGLEGDVRVMHDIVLGSWTQSESRDLRIRWGMRW